jgi:hypothetical protein
MSNLAVVNGSAISNSAPSGSLSIQTVDDLGRIAKMMAASGFFADCKDAAQAGVKIMAGLELGFPAFASLVGIQIIKGKPVMGANLQAAAIKRSGKYNYRVKEHTPLNCSIEFLERFDGKWESCGTSDFSMDDAKAAGLNGGDNWRKYPKNMLFARAVSNGVRWYCPDLFLGAPVYTPDEFGIPVNEEGEAIGVASEVVPAPALKSIPVQTVPAIITESQIKRFWTIANKQQWTKEMVGAMLAENEYFDADGAASSKVIPVAEYDRIVEILKDENTRNHYAAAMPNDSEVVDAEEIANPF